MVHMEDEGLWGHLRFRVIFLVEFFSCLEFRV